jgi:hypothetical protein
MGQSGFLQRDIKARDAKPQPTPVGRLRGYAGLLRGPALEIGRVPGWGWAKNLTTKKQMCAYCLLRGMLPFSCNTQSKGSTVYCLTPWSGHGLVATGLLGRRPPPRAPVPLCAARETMAVLGLLRRQCRPSSRVLRKSSTSAEMYQWRQCLRFIAFRGAVHNHHDQ